MPFEVRFIPCFMITYIAGKRKLSSMDPHMSRKSILIISFVSTVITRKFVITGIGMDQHMSSRGTFGISSVFTVVT